MTTVYVTADWTFTPATLTLRYIASDEEIVLDPKSARLLGYLIRCHPQVCTREEIYHELYGIENARADGTITAYVSKLRKLLETKVDAKGKYIKTIPKTGYQFVAPHRIETLSLKQSFQQTVGSHTDYVPNTDALAPVEPISVDKVDQNEGPLGQLNRLPMSRNIIWAIVVFIIVLFVGTQIIYNSNSDKNHSRTTHVSTDLNTSDWRLIHAESGINHSVAISDDNLFLAYVSAQQDTNRLFVKSVLAEQLNIVFESESQKIYSPVFSPSGQQVAFITVNSQECSLNLIQLTAQSELVEDSHTIVGTCDAKQKTTPLSFLDENNLLFIAHSNSNAAGALSTLDISSGTVQAIENYVESNLSVEPLAADYYFAIHRANQQIALLKRQKNGASGLYLIQMNEKEMQHIVTVEESLSGLEWLNTEKLIVMKKGQLQLIDLDEKDIRPVTFAQVKEVLNTKSS